MLSDISIVHVYIEGHRNHDLTVVSLHLPMYSVPITTNVISSIHACVNIYTSVGGLLVPGEIIRPVVSDMPCYSNADLLQTDIRYTHLTIYR